MMRKSFLFLTCFCLGTVWFGCTERRAESSDSTLTDSSYIAHHLNKGGDSPLILMPRDTLKFCRDMPFVESFFENGREKAAGISTAFWPARTTELKVYFMDGDTTVIRKVMTIANLWEPYSGIKFKQVSQDSSGDIKVSFKANGTWSAIGRQALYKYPSMNLGWLTPSTDDLEYRRVALHEFGHALGLIHEHQNPLSKEIKWDVKYVKNYFKPIWSEPEIEANIFKRYQKSSINGTAYDSLSIMMYAIPAEFRLDRIATPWNRELSALDRFFVGSKYKNNPINLSK